MIMSFPFRSTTPGKGRYSGAIRDPVAEMAFDEGDSDAPYKKHAKMLDDPAVVDKFEDCWNDRITKNRSLYEKEHLRLWAIAQSHVDIAWLWRLYQTINKAKITQGKAAYHVLAHPEFKYTFSQPVMLEWLEQVHPDVFENVKKAVATGRFDLQGGDYVECDAKMPSGESFCRQRLVGQRYYLEKFGKTAEVGWLPDSFGYSNNIPQFLVKSGCKYFYTQKISGNWPPEAFPFIHFRWRAPDGSEVITYDNNFQFRPIVRWQVFGKYRRLCKPGATLTCDYTHPDPASDPALGDIYPEVGIMFGTGDGGHGPTCEEVHRMRHYVKTGKVAGFLTGKEYFQMYEQVRDRLPTWNAADLFYNLHHGTLTTQGLVKRMNRHFEHLLAGLETLHAASAFITGQLEPGIHARIAKAWKKVLLLQFHDILPGSSIPEVYDDAYDIWIENQQEINRVQALLPGFDEEPPAAVDKNACVVIANPSAYKGRAAIEIPLPAGAAKPGPFSIVDASGAGVPCQVVPGEPFDESLLDRPARAIACIDLEPWSIQGWRSRAGAVDAPKATIEETMDAIAIVTSFSRVVVSKKTGAVESYKDLAIGKEIFSRPSAIKVYRDWFSIERAWNMSPGYKECPFDTEEFTFVSAKVTERGPVRVTIEVEHAIPESKSTFTQRVQVYPAMPGLFFELAIGWHQQEAVAKQCFSLASNPDKIIAEGPYTTEIYVADPAKRTHLDAQRWECCMQSWVACPAPDDSWGVAIANDGKYGFDADKDTIGITLVRGPDYPGPAGYAAEERKKRNGGSPPTHTDQGKHFVRYAILPYAGPWRAGGFQKRAHQLNAPAICQFRRGIVGKPLATDEAITTLSANLEIAAMKRAEDAPRSPKVVILRVVEQGRVKTRGKVILSRDLHVTDVRLVDLVERDVADRQLDVVRKDGNITSFSCDWNPHEVLTFKVTRA